MKKNGTLIGFAIILIAIITSCAKMPQEEYDAAQDAMDSLKVHFADVYLPDEFEEFEEDWDDLFGIKIGPFGMGAYFGPKPFRVRYSKTADSHLIRLKVNQDVKKEEIKVNRSKDLVARNDRYRRQRATEIPLVSRH